ncbi:protein phosphatase 1 regulatory subunit 37-like, partial [Scleropages formosus]
KRKGKKRVTFPPDEDMVSDFVEHSETQRPVYNVTLKEVTSAYKQRCLKHQVDPKSKVLKQIEEGTAECSHPKQLDLQGERLDYHSCESLEDILKLLQFDFINLRETQLEENSRCLRRLDVSNMPLLDDIARMLSGALLCSRLTVLCLENSCLSGRPLFTLVGTLKKNTSLEELCLANNKLNSFQDSMQLGDLLKYNHCLQYLDLSNNLISDPGLEEICEGLRAQKSNLRTLLLCGNYLTEQGMVHLATVLPGIKTLETLNLGNNNLQNQGIQRLKDSLIASCSLQQLCLACTQITCEGVVALAEFIAESRKIQQLDIQENLVGTGGLMALSLALKINHSLVRVAVDHKPKENE